MFNFRKVITCQKIPRLGIYLPNARDENQNCFILSAIFNQIKRKSISWYHIYSSTLFYINVSISTVLRVCVLDFSERHRNCIFLAWFCVKSPFKNPLIQPIAVARQLTILSGFIRKNYYNRHTCRNIVDVNP